MNYRIKSQRVVPHFLLLIAVSALITACGSGDEEQPGTGGGGTSDGSGLPGTSQTFIDKAVQRVNAARAVPRQCGATLMPAQAALSWNAKAEQAALSHSQWMRQTEIIDHTGENGSSPGDRLTDAGYTWSAVAENVAAGYADLDAVIDGWLSSEGHCQNIMSDNVTELGVALVNGGSGNTYTTYWTMVLAAPL